MGYTAEQIKEYRLTPEQIGTFRPRLSQVEQDVIRNHIGSRAQTVSQAPVALFRQQILDDQRPELANPKNTARMRFAGINLQIAHLLLFL